MVKLPRESVNSDIAFSPGVQDIAQMMRQESNGRELTTKELMILTSIDEMVKTGPVDFNSGVVCHRLSVKEPLVNHYFGSKDALIADATVWAYRAWSFHVVAALKSGATDPEKKLRAFIDAELKWSRQMGAVAVLIQYPLLATNVKSYISTNFSGEMEKYFEYHLALLTTVVANLRNNDRSPMDFDLSNYPRKQLVMKYPQEFLDATSIAWSIHGLALWSSDSHSATRNFSKEVVRNISTKLAISNHVENIIALAKGK